MFPHERALVKRLADKPFALIGVNSDTDREYAIEQNKISNITWRSFWNSSSGKRDDPESISGKWNVKGWPTLYLIDSKGIIREKWKGNPGEEAIDESINGLLKEMGVDVAAK